MTALRTYDTTDYNYATLWIDLGRARTALAAKDTPGNREAVEAALAAFDEVFDARRAARS